MNLHFYKVITPCYRCPPWFFYLYLVMDEIFYLDPF
jgi:hypothetical protein